MFKLNATNPAARLRNLRAYRESLYRQSNNKHEGINQPMQVSTNCDQCGGSIEQGEPRQRHHGATLCSGTCLSTYKEAKSRADGQREVALARDRREPLFGLRSLIGTVDV